MTEIRRDIESVESKRFDLIVIGGGIFGSCMLLEASRRGWKTLLVERDDFGGATSWNSLRILHGGLRYLQHMDFARFRRSVREQAWWLTHFPDLVEPLPCIMPLYNKGLHRTNVLRWALMLNDWLAKSIRSGTPAAELLAASRVFDPAQTLAEFPMVRTKGLKGAAYWFDVRMRSPQRLLIEMLRWSIAAGGEVLNYAECIGFDRRGARAESVKVRCRVSNKEFAIQTDYVVNCAGPWVGDVEDLAGLNARDSARKKSHLAAFNLVLNRTPLSRSALAVSPSQSKTTQTYFLVPHAGKTLAGTQYLRPHGGTIPSNEQISAFLSDLNLAIPGWELSPADVGDVLVGRLPPDSVGSYLPAKSPTITHLGELQGIQNMTSVAGPKYTTARKVAETVFHQIARRRGLGASPGYSKITRPPTIERPNLSRLNDYSGLAQELRRWIAHESVIQVDDLVLRRCDLPKDVQAPLVEWLVASMDWPPNLQ